jgi:hypothetical protein
MKCKQNHIKSTVAADDGTLTSAGYATNGADLRQSKIRASKMRIKDGLLLYRKHVTELH